MHARYLMLLMVLLIVFLPYDSRAEKATQAEMELVCKNWLSYMVYQKGIWAGVSNPQISGVQEITNGDTLFARCYSISPKGFVVVPILKELPPINTYSDDCNLDPNQGAGFPQMVRDVLLNRVRLYIKIYGSLDAFQPDTGEVLLGREHKAEWEKFNKSESSFQSDLVGMKFGPMTEVDPLLTTRWHQDAPYNSDCPIGDEECVTCPGGGSLATQYTYIGCIALAAAQIIRYWEWPERGVWSHSYVWDGDQSCGGSSAGGTLNTILGAPFDWNNMPDDCESGCTETQTNALVYLCNNVSIAFETDYGVCNSSAYMSHVTWVLPSLFCYDTSIDREARSDHTAASWFSIIKTEINNSRPMMYYIFGHGIVCDGWRDTGGLNQYHMNYGWGGSYTGWYTIDNLYCPWAGCDPMVEALYRYIMPGSGPAFIVTSPNGGESWLVSSDHTITWSSLCFGNRPIKIQYSTNGGSDWITITGNTSNDGSYQWIVPNTPSSACRV